MRKGNRIAAILVFVGSLSSAMQAQAFLPSLTPLQAVLKQSTFIVTAEVESVDAGKPELVVVVDEDLKGKSPLRRSCSPSSRRCS